MSGVQCLITLVVFIRLNNRLSVTIFDIDNKFDTPNIRSCCTEGFTFGWFFALACMSVGSESDSSEWEDDPEFIHGELLVNLR